MTSITINQLIDMEPCNPQSRIALFGKRKSMTAAQAFEAGATISDLLWVANKIGRRDDCIIFALACSRRVEHLDKTDKSKKCNDTLETYITEKSEINIQTLKKVRTAAYAAAYAAADAYAAAAYAAYAADAAAYAADAAAYAAYAADAAAYAAYAADARKNEIEEQKKLFVEIFK